MMCFRCEHRARYLSDLSNHKKCCHRPRHECGDIETSKYICYMFTPCLPIITTPNNPKDIRPRLSSPMLSARERGVRVMDREELKMELIYQNEEEIALGWRVK